MHIADQHTLAQKQQERLRLIKGTPALAKMSELLAAVHEKMGMHLKGEYQSRQHCAVLVWKVHEAGTRGYIGQHHICPQFCMGPAGSGSEALH